MRNGGIRVSSFIAKQIIKQAKISTEKGQAKYRAYFIKTPIYLDWKEEVDSILEIECYQDCIVSE